MVTGETPAFVIGSFVLTIPFVLILASDITVLYENHAFSILVLSIKKCYSSFLKKFFVFQKVFFKVKVLKTFKTSTDCHIRTCRSLKSRFILKIPSTVFFRRTYTLSVGFKMEPMNKSDFQC